MTARSRGRLLAVVSALDVAHNPLFQRRPLEPGGPVHTFCNQYVAAALSELAAPLPPGKLAREQIGWLDGPSARALGWYECTEGNAVDLAELGQPTVACWVNPDAAHSSHIALCVPAVGGTGLHVAQAGATNFDSAPLAHGFGSKTPIRFFTFP